MSKLAPKLLNWLKKITVKSMTFGISSLNLAFAILRMEKYTFGFPFTISALPLLSQNTATQSTFLWVIDWFIFVTSLPNEISI
jgi:hypothetical protein